MQSNVLQLNADKALEQLGVWGRYQLCVFVLANVCWAFVCFQMMSAAFSTSTPPFACVDDATVQIGQWTSNCEVETNVNESIRCGDGIESPSFVFDGNFGETIVSEWNLVCDRDIYGQMSTSFFFFGVTIGSLVIPSMADRYGRRIVILVFSLLLSLMGIGTAFSPSFVFFTLFRFCSGITTAGLSLPSWVLACEVMAPSKRSYGVACQGIFWVFGYCITGVIAYFVPDWRTFYLIGSVPSLILLAYYWLIPESVHWYVAQGKMEKAWDWIEKAARINKVEMKMENCVEEHCRKSSRKTESLVDSCRCIPLVIQTIIMAYLWISNTFVYYGLSLFTTELAGNRYVNYILSGIIEIPAYLILNPVLNWLGRRKAISIYHFVAGLALLGLMFVENGSKLNSILWLLGKFSISSSFMGVWLYAVEVFPTTVRASGLGICNISARIGGILAPFSKSLRLINPYLVPALFGFSSLFAGLLTLILPETAHVKLADEVAEVDYGLILGKCFSKKEIVQRDKLLHSSIINDALI